MILRKGKLYLLDFSPTGTCASIPLKAVEVKLVSQSLSAWQLLHVVNAADINGFFCKSNLEGGGCSKYGLTIFEDRRRQSVHPFTSIDIGRAQDITLKQSPVLHSDRVGQRQAAVRRLYGY